MKNGSRAAAALKTDPKDGGSGGGQIDFMISRKVKSTWRIERGIAMEKGTGTRVQRDRARRVGR